MQVTPFDLFIAQYKRSAKYIDKVLLRDFDRLDNSANKAKIPAQRGINTPFEGSLFSLDSLTTATTLFYYIVKQNTHFLLDFKDQKSLFKQTITRYKQFDMDLNNNPLNIYNLILASLY